MPTERESRLARKVYNAMRNLLEKMGVRYLEHEEELVLTCTVRGEDIPMDLLIFIHEEQQLVRILSPMPFVVPEKKRVDMAVAVSTVNYGLVDGSFDYDISDGSLRFRLTSSFRESILGEELLKYLFMVTTFITDEYNDRFMLLAKGVITLEQFLEKARPEEKPAAPSE